MSKSYSLARSGCVLYVVSFWRSNNVARWHRRHLNTHGIIWHMLSKISR